ncbi:MAG: transposase [Microcystis aeruginosa Ma_QC_C_20070703_M131]|uniref:Transposase n=1 Tax=Microcystis aeruginosa Ma_QC_C_20070703_M131 TaxID=2486263 RepID=A0A551Y7R0_MICAE|nr:MAG: transposase [Microcystis aeruginosa Ma_QC_C_20070703_M131]
MLEKYIVCVAVPPHFASQDCSVCGTRVQKTLSTRTHQCPHCQTVLDRDHNAAINILKKGLQYLGNHLNGTVGQTETDPNISNSNVERIPGHSVA